MSNRRNPRRNIARKQQSKRRLAIMFREKRENSHPDAPVFLRVGSAPAAARA